MRRVLILFAALSLAALAVAAPQYPGRSQRFDPVEVVSTAELYYPPTSVAFGTVVLELTIDESGAIEKIRVVKDIKSLTPEAERCVRKWTFRPARLAGRPITSTIPVAFTFNNPYTGPPH